MVFRRLIAKAVSKRGYGKYAAELAADKLIRDFGLRKLIGYRNMLSAYRAGFTGAFFKQLLDAGVDPKECMPDIHYLKLHPVNGRFSHWINDKLTLKYLLSRYDNYLPAYYFYCAKGAITRLMDCPEDLPEGPKGIIQLLRTRQYLALKKASGSLSVGFHRLEATQGQSKLDGKPASEQQLTQFIVGLEDYLVTEYVHAHPMLKRLYEKSPNIVRLIVANPHGHNPEVAAAYLRIGQNHTGFVELSSSGGLFAGVALQDGRIFAPKLFDGPRVQEVFEHPDTGVALEGLLPNWNYVVTSILQISRYVPNLRYLGWDLIITEDGFRIIEINSLPGISYIQLYHPLLRNPAAAELFGRRYRPNSGSGVPGI